MTSSFSESYGQIQGEIPVVNQNITASKRKPFTAVYGTSAHSDMITYQPRAVIPTAGHVCAYARANHVKNDAQGGTGYES